MLHRIKKGLGCSLKSFQIIESPEKNAHLAALRIFQSPCFSIRFPHPLELIEDF